ncbi:MAG: hypothetical protein HZA53_09130, partial [Planctomycetes bacterium]|nr:hypothetical protein [Planctomycetota bacterium]
MSTTPSRATRTLAWTALAVATLVAFAPMRANGFLWWDDAIYVTENPAVRAGLSRGSIEYAITSGDAGNWHPLTWLAHMLDVELFGLVPAGHHAVSVALHVLSALLLGALVLRWTGRFAVAWFVAALFALHPLRVESVAWAAELKDVLCHFLFVLALHAWTTWVRRPGVIAYGATMVFVTLGLLAKPMLVSFPLLLLVLDVWPFARVRWPSVEPARLGPNARPVAGLVLEKLPFAVLAAASCAITLLVQRAGGAMHVESGPAFLERVANAVAALARYAGKTLVPVDLSPHYAWRSPWSSPAFVLGVVGLFVALLLAWRWRRARPWLGAGLAWFAIALLPVLGLVQVGDQALADRYTYLPGTGLVLVLVLGAVELARWLRAERVLALL